MTEDRKLSEAGRICPTHRQPADAIGGGVRCTPYRLSTLGASSPLALLTLLPLLLSVGCRNRALDQAQQEAREAKTTINKLNYSLKTAQEKIATMEAELSSVKLNRDALQKQVDRLTRERDQAAMFAQQAQEAITRLTTQATGQGSATAALQKQVVEFKTLVDEQQKLIDQLRAEVAAQPATPPPAQTADKPSTPDPNERS